MLLHCDAVVVADGRYFLIVQHQKMMNSQLHSARTSDAIIIVDLRTLVLVRSSTAETALDITHLRVAGCVAITSSSDSSSVVSPPTCLPFSACKFNWFICLSVLSIYLFWFHVGCFGMRFPNRFLRSADRFSFAESFLHQSCRSSTFSVVAGTAGLPCS